MTEYAIYKYHGLSGHYVLKITGKTYNEIELKLNKWVKKHYRKESKFRPVCILSQQSNIEII